MAPIPAQTWFGSNPEFVMMVCRRGTCWRATRAMMVTMMSPKYARGVNLSYLPQCHADKVDERLHYPPDYREARSESGHHGMIANIASMMSLANAKV
jgi:hypothetical protein